MLASELGCTDLTILDTSHPDTIQSTNFENVNLVVSSKSGGTVETIASMAYALSHGARASDLTIITDPGTPLDELGQSLGAVVLQGDPQTGGRFSALSVFGIAPILIAGATSVPETVLGEEEWIESFVHGMQAAPPSGWDTMTVSGDPLTSFTALWEEQLLAESTGKDGKGLLPTPGAPRKILDIALHVQRTHAFTVGLCTALGVNPFDQPDVESAKRRTFAELSSPTPDEFIDPANLGGWIERGGPFVLQVYGPLSCAPEVASLRSSMAMMGHEVSAGLGPRYLHSTGQIHKGGSASLRFLQILIEPSSTPERISGREYSFHDLLGAQARGDFQDLTGRGRDVVRVKLAPGEHLLGLLH
ncbi:unannotated protein [freshwater metagenome]|uniref:Unannotated protein n=1 Tax=freshwater metagenome TaxID=449393 RepID=A0A6J7CK22_9ZZZZ